MSDPIGKLDLETHRRVFTGTVVPNSALPHTTPQAHPQAIVLAGQPGAGKGNLVLAARLEFSRNIVTIDPDAQREHHPDFKKLRESHPYTWSGHTHYDASRWAGELRDAAVAGRRNLIMDTTLGHADGAIRTIKSLQAKGYRVEVRAVATHRLESEVGVDQRFTDSLREKGYGRHVPGDFHDAAYKALPANLDKVHEQTGARLRIYSREGVELYDSRATPNLKPSIALGQAREARMADPKITRSTAEDARTQQDFHRKLPETLERNPKISSETTKNLPPERQAQGVVPRIERAATETAAVDRTVRIEPGAARVALGLKVAGAAALAHDAVTTGREAGRLLDQNNLTGAQSEVLHFAGRNLGMAGGAMAVGAMAAAAGIETGPGAVAFGLAGGMLGAIAGDKIMNAADQSRIYSQRGSDGYVWKLDPQQPAQGWTRLPLPGEFGPEGPPSVAAGGPVYENHQLHAPPRLAGELNYKASSLAVELALARAPADRDPFRQPSELTGEVGRAGIAGGSEPWTRDPQSHAWTRQTLEPATPMSHGMPVLRTVAANPAQTLQLDRAAQATVADNVAHSPQAIAGRYQAAYEQNGWQQHGPVPEAVRTAQGPVHGELDATRQRVRAPAQPVVDRPTPQQIERIATHESRVAHTPGGMSFAEAHKRRDEPEQISPGSLQPVGKLAKPDRLHELTLLREIGIVNAKVKEELGNAPNLRTTLQPSLDRTQQRAQDHTQDLAPRRTLNEAAMQPMPSPEMKALTPQTMVPALSDTTTPPAPDSQEMHARLAAKDAELAAARAQIARLTVQGFAVPQASESPAARAEPSAPARHIDPRDHAHPDHKDFQKIFDVLAQDGRWNAPQSASIASQALADFKGDRLAKRLDVVLLEPDTRGQLKLFVGHAPWGGLRCLSVAAVDPVQAARVPPEQGFERLEQATQMAQQREIQDAQRWAQHYQQHQGNEQSPRR